VINAASFLKEQKNVQKGQIIESKSGDLCSDNKNKKRTA